MESELQRPSRFYLETVSSRSAAARRIAGWRMIAAGIPEAEVRALRLYDEVFMLYSKHVDLISPEERQRQNEAARKRIEDQRNHGSVEDRDAIDTAGKLLDGTLTLDIETQERWMDDYERKYPNGEWALEPSGENEP